MKNQQQKFINKKRRIILRSVASLQEQVQCYTCIDRKLECENLTSIEQAM